MEPGKPDRKDPYQRLEWVISFIFVAAAVMGVALAGALFTLIIFAIRWLLG